MSETRIYWCWKADSMLHTMTFMKPGLAGVGWSNEALRWRLWVWYYQQTEKLNLMEQQLWDHWCKLKIAKALKCFPEELQNGLAVGQVVILLLTPAECGQRGRPWTNTIVDPCWLLIKVCREVLGAWGIELNAFLKSSKATLPKASLLKWWIISLKKRGTMTS